MGQYVDVSTSLKLVGTYSVNAKIDVSTYSPKNNNQFLLVPCENFSTSTSYTWWVAYQTYVYPNAVCTFTQGSTSLSGSQLTITLPKTVITCTDGNNPVTKYIKCNLYYVE